MIEVKNTENLPACHYYGKDFKGLYSITDLSRRNKISRRAARRMANRFVKDGTFERVK